VNNSNAEIQIDGEGKRGHDSLAVFGMIPEASLTMSETVSNLGTTPRNITIDPTNQYFDRGHSKWQLGRRIPDRHERSSDALRSPQKVAQACGVAFVKAQ